MYIYTCIHRKIPIDKNLTHVTFLIAVSLILNNTKSYILRQQTLIRNIMNVHTCMSLHHYRNKKAMFAWKHSLHNPYIFRHQTLIRNIIVNVEISSHHYHNVYVKIYSLHYH